MNSILKNLHNYIKDVNIKVRILGLLSFFLGIFGIYIVPFVTAEITIKLFGESLATTTRKYTLFQILQEYYNYELNISDVLYPIIILTIGSLSSLLGSVLSRRVIYIGGITQLIGIGLLVNNFVLHSAESSEFIEVTSNPHIGILFIIIAPICSFLIFLLTIWESG